MSRHLAFRLAALLACVHLVGLATCPAFGQPAGTTGAVFTSASEERTAAGEGTAPGAGNAHASVDPWPLLFVFALSTFIGIGVVARVSRLLHTPLMSITNAISAIAVVGSILVTGSDFPQEIRLLGAVALFASMTNIVSGFLITDRMLKMFRQDAKEARKK